MFKGSRGEGAEHGMPGGTEVLNTPNIVRLLLLLLLHDWAFTVRWLMNWCVQPSTLDYFQVVYSLCDLLVHVYRKLLDPSLLVNKEMRSAIAKIDTRFKVLPRCLLCRRDARGALRAVPCDKDAFHRAHCQRHERVGDQHGQATTRHTRERLCRLCHAV